MRSVDELIAEGIRFLAAIDMPREQQNERSSLTLLGLLGLTTATPWAEATAPLRGITQLMSYFREHFGKDYAPNTRETVRRFTMHQFVEAGIAVCNPDAPSRPINSPKWCYQATEPAVRLARAFGSPSWTLELERFGAEVGSLRARNAADRAMTMIPVNVGSEQQLRLTPGGQNDLIKAIIEEFCPRFAPGAELLYVGDAGQKWAYFNEEALLQLGIEVDAHGKMPDVVVYQPEKNWLLLIEAVTNHGPVNAKRARELLALVEGTPAGLVFVTAFEDRSSFARYAADICWETEVWCADSPTHMIHFNGDRFLGPH